jgi:hypothetical protein
VSGIQRLDKQKKILLHGLIFGRVECNRALLEIVSNLGEPSDEEIANAAGRDIYSIQDSLRSLVHARKLKRTAAGTYQLEKRH